MAALLRCFGLGSCLAADPATPAPRSGAQLQSSCESRGSQPGLLSQERVQEDHHVEVVSSLPLPADFVEMSSPSTRLDVNLKVPISASDQHFGHGLQEGIAPNFKLDASVDDELICLLTMLKPVVAPNPFQFSKCQPMVAHRLRTTLLAGQAEVLMSIDPSSRSATPDNPFAVPQALMQVPGTPIGMDAHPYLDTTRTSTDRLGSNSCGHFFQFDFDAILPTRASEDLDQADTCKCGSLEPPLVTFGSTPPWKKNGSQSQVRFSRLGFASEPGCPVVPERTSTAAGFLAVAHPDAGEVVCNSPLAMSLAGWAQGADCNLTASFKSDTVSNSPMLAAPAQAHADLEAGHTSVPLPERPAAWPAESTRMTALLDSPGHVSGGPTTMCGGSVLDAMACHESLEGVSCPAASDWRANMLRELLIGAPHDSPSAQYSRSKGTGRASQCTSATARSGFGECTTAVRCYSFVAVRSAALPSLARVRRSSLVSVCGRSSLVSWGSAMSFTHVF